MVRIEKATLRDVSWIAAHMRAQDRREIGAVRPIDSTSGLASELLFSSCHTWVAFLGREPVTALGLVRIAPKVLSGWAFGTDRMRRTVPALTRFAVEKIAPAMVRDGFRRVEVRTAIDHDLAHHWLHGMGFIREGIARDYGEDLDFVTYAATAADWRARNVLFDSQNAQASAASAAADARG